MRPDQVMVNCEGCGRSCYGAVVWMDDEGDTHRACSSYCKTRKMTLRLVEA